VVEDFFCTVGTATGRAPCRLLVWFVTCGLLPSVKWHMVQYTVQAVLKPETNCVWGEYKSAHWHPYLSEMDLPS